MSPVLVTGGSGYVGTQLIAALLRDGRPVRATVRSLEREGDVRAAVRRGDADDAGLEVVAADLTADDGWAAAVAGCEEVHHVASPIPVQPDDPDELIVPAREGTLRVLRAARDAGVRRVVLTSSFAAVGYSPKPGAEFTEADWTDPDTPGLAPYPRSKAIAERAAWDLIERDGGDTELVVVNPTFILGPTLTTELRSSLQLIKAMLDGTMSVAPRQRFGVADVRDVADLHIRAMAAPGAAGKRFLAVADGPTISYLEVAEILRRRLGPLAARVPTEEAPGDEPPRLIIHNDRAQAGVPQRVREVVEPGGRMGQIEVDQRGGQPVSEDHVARVVVAVADQLGPFADRASHGGRCPAPHRVGWRHPPGRRLVQRTDQPGQGDDHVVARCLRRQRVARHVTGDERQHLAPLLVHAERKRRAGEPASRRWPRYACTVRLNSRSGRRTVSPIRTIPWVTPSPTSSSPSDTPQQPHQRPRTPAVSRARTSPPSQALGRACTPSRSRPRTAAFPR